MNIVCPITWCNENLSELAAFRKIHHALFNQLTDAPREEMTEIQEQIRTLFDTECKLKLEHIKQKNGLYLGMFLLCSSDLTRFTSYEAFSETLKHRDMSTEEGSPTRCACGKESVQWMTTIQCEFNSVLIGSRCCCNTGIMSVKEFNRIKRENELVACKECPTMVKRKYLVQKCCALCESRKLRSKCTACLAPIKSAKFGGKCFECNVSAKKGACEVCAKPCNPQFKICFTCNVAQKKVCRV